MGTFGSSSSNAYWTKQRGEYTHTHIHTYYAHAQNEEVANCMNCHQKMCLGTMGLLNYLNIHIIAKKDAIGCGPTVRCFTTAMAYCHTSELIYRRKWRTTCIQYLSASSQDFLSTDSNCIAFKLFLHNSFLQKRYHRLISQRSLQIKFNPCVWETNVATVLC